LEVSVQNFTQLGGRADFYVNLFGVLLSGLMRFRDGSNKGTASHFVQISEKVQNALAVIRQSFGEETMSRTRVFERNALFKADGKGETSEEQSQEHAHHFLRHHGDG
jgi:hypothetical protein